MPGTLGQIVGVLTVLLASLIGFAVLGPRPILGGGLLVFAALRAVLLWNGAKNQKEIAALRARQRALDEEEKAERREPDEVPPPG